MSCFMFLESKRGRSEFWKVCIFSQMAHTQPCQIHERWLVFPKVCRHFKITFHVTCTCNCSFPLLLSMQKCKIKKHDAWRRLRRMGKARGKKLPIRFQRTLSIPTPPHWDHHLFTPSLLDRFCAFNRQSFNRWAFPWQQWGNFYLLNAYCC